MISGVAMGTSWLFLYEAYRQIGVSVATLAYYCGPVFVMVLSPILFKEKLTWTKVCGFLAVLTGMFLVNMQVLSEGKNAFGVLYGIMSAVLYACMVIFIRRQRALPDLKTLCGS